MPRKFDVVVSPVREVSLVGRADLSYCRERLAPHALHATEIEGRGEMLLSACEARFKGVRIRELSLSIFVAREAGSSARDGALLLRAFNSIRFFAWVERTLFRTPYYCGRIAVSPDPPVSIRLGDDDNSIVRATMGDTDSAKPLAIPAVADGWQGPIFLPDLHDAAAPAARLFYGSLTGDTRTIPFHAKCDVFRLGPTASDPIAPLLTDARFEPAAWIVRAAATHGKSKTIRRTPGEEFAGFADGKIVT
ncbi:MAG: hypothetical protein DCC68_02600 [Planctomycetota bacterium]|nr:MAG: hypothetical protein DCC68_02600 [Planctomycetota bacterium]